jgi:hypothetical protein
MDQVLPIDIQPKNSWPPGPSNSVACRATPLSVSEYCELITSRLPLERFSDARIGITLLRNSLSGQIYRIDNPQTLR